MLNIILLVLTGIAAGIIGGMGMGGGTLLIPMLTIFFDIPQHTAQAINLTAFIPMSIAAIIIHIKNKLINFKTALFVLIPAALASAGGAFAAKNIEGSLLQKLFGIFLVLLAILQTVMLILTAKDKKLK